MLHSDVDPKRNLYSNGSQFQHTPLTSPSKSISSSVSFNHKPTVTEQHLGKFSTPTLAVGGVENLGVNVSAVSLNFIDENEEVQNFDGYSDPAEKKLLAVTSSLQAGSESPFMNPQSMAPFPSSGELDVQYPLNGSSTSPRPNLRRTASHPPESKLA